MKYTPGYGRVKESGAVHREKKRSEKISKSPCVITKKECSERARRLKEIYKLQVS